MMTHWNHKNMETLADAVRNSLTNIPPEARERSHLESVFEQARKLSKFGMLSSGDLASVRGNLCAVCRDASLHPCDTPRGWSQFCAFVRNNNN
jgi:hypothetical protein